MNELTQFLSHYGYIDQSYLTQKVGCLQDAQIQQALKDYQYFNHYTMVELAETLDLPMESGGELGPLTRALIKQPRCGFPDKAIDLLGSGSWPVGCHTPGIHEVIIKVNKSGMPSALAPIFNDVLDLVKAAYTDIGMKLTFVDESWTGPVNIDFSFERLRGSTIGLAIVPRGPGCGSRIWCKYHPGYTPSQMLYQWARLIAHELGHNMGLGHYRGGIMNSSILSGIFTKTEWRGDPAESRLRSWFGIPIPDPKPEAAFSFGMVVTNDGMYMNGNTPSTFTFNNKTYHGKTGKLI